MRLRRLATMLERGLRRADTGLHWPLRDIPGEGHRHRFTAVPGPAPRSPAVLRANVADRRRYAICLLRGVAALSLCRQASEARVRHQFDRRTAGLLGATRRA